MNAGFGLPSIDTQCVECGAERAFPEGKATRVLEGDDLFAELDEPCEACGSNKVRVAVSFEDDGPAKHEGSRSKADLDR